jgi:hypothetical protein
MACFTALVFQGLLLLAAPVRAQSQPDAGVRIPAVAAPTVQDRLVAEAEKYLGKPYNFGGRDGRPGCVGAKRCAEGIDCLSPIFFAYEKVLGTPWARFSVKPSELVQRRQLGVPVKGLEGALEAEVDRSLLRKGDVLLFLQKDYNLEADKPLLVRGDDRYGVWHTALVQSVEGDKVMVIQAKPGDRVVVEPLEAVFFERIVALRLPPSRR